MTECATTTPSGNGRDKSTGKGKGKVVEEVKLEDMDTEEVQQELESQFFVEWVGHPEEKAGHPDEEADWHKAAPGLG